MTITTRQALCSNPRSTPDLPACDCTNYCGDDPNVFNGKAQPCPASAALQAKREESSELHLLAFELAEELARARIEFAGHKVLVNGTVHHNTEPALSQSSSNEWATHIKKAARFLVLSKRAEPHPTKPHLLRIL